MTRSLPVAGGVDDAGAQSASSIRLKRSAWAMASPEAGPPVSTMADTADKWQLRAATRVSPGAHAAMTAAWMPAEREGGDISRHHADHPHSPLMAPLLLK